MSDGQNEYPNNFENETKIFEIFENGIVKKEELKINEESFYEQFLFLSPAIAKNGLKESLVETILAEICTLTNSEAVSVWNFSTKMTIKQLPEKDCPNDTYIKNFAGNSRHSKKNVISNDVTQDFRFKKIKKLRKRAKEISLPAILKKKSKPVLMEERCIAIIQLSNDSQLVLEGTKHYTLENIGKIYHLAIFLLRFRKKYQNLKKESIKPVQTLFGTSSDSDIEMFPENKQKEKEEAKDVFLAAVSHDLRTPLNGIVGMITMLRDAGPINEKQQKYLTILMECTNQLMTMIGNILDFSKISSKRFVLAKEPLDIKKAVKDASLMVEGRAQSKNIAFNVDVQEDIPVLLGDLQRLTQIITNLLSNAVKFTSKGFVKLSMRGERIVDVSSYVKKWNIIFEIRDSGIGIPKVDQTRIFEIFDQGTSSITRNGTGLGLTVSRELAKLMGGDIEVQSSGIKGEGSLFTFHIVVEQEIRLESLSEEDSENIKNSKILVVDDRAEYRMQIADMLFKWGCHPVVVGSGEEALLIISHSPDFDIMLVDICMPYLSGSDLATELRALKTEAYLIALSSVDLPQAGIELFDFYMNKPIDQNTLLPVLIRAATRQKKVTNVCSLTDITKRGRKKRKDLKILIAEDDKNNSFTIREMLFYLGFDYDNIKIVENGKECIKKVKAEQFDVVLMDIIMPKLDGLETTKYLRQFNPRPYIIAVSAAVHSSDKQRCQRVGIDSYLSKPVIKEKLEGAMSPLISD